MNFFFSLIPLPPRSTLFPYTTLFRSIMTAASAVLLNAFLTGDYSIKYVVRYSDSVQPLLYKITSYWGGLDGSIRSEEHTSELQSRPHLVCRLLLEKKNDKDFKNFNLR